MRNAALGVCRWCRRRPPDRKTLQNRYASSANHALAVRRAGYSYRCPAVQVADRDSLLSSDARGSCQGHGEVIATRVCHNQCVAVYLTNHPVDGLTELPTTRCAWRPTAET
jgi:hypothetical protein